MKRFILAGLVLAFGAVSQAATVTYNPATGVLLYPANFFEINSNLIVAAISGAFPGTGSGNASTNVAQGWSASQTFNGPVFVGSTNLNTHLASKAPLASPAFTGTPTVPTASANSSNTTAATTAYVDRAVAGVSAGGGGNASTNVAQVWSADQTFSNITVTGSATMGDLSVASISPATAIPIIHGGSGATTAAGARTNFGLIIGSDVQAYSARLADIAGISYSTGDLIYWNGSALVRMPIGTNGQVVGVSGGALTYINQTGTGGGGVTNFSALADVALSSPIEGQVPVYNGTTSKWNNRTPATNPLLVNWIGGYGIGSRTNYNVSTNVLLASFSVPPSADPAVNGRFLSGSASMQITNATVSSQAFDFRILAAGVKVVETTRGLSAALYETYNFSFRVVRESATTASIYADGVGVASSSTANAGIGTFGGQVRDFSVVATNAAWDWAATNSLDLYVGLNMSGTNTLIGVTRLAAGLYALVDNAAIISDAAYGAGWNGDTNHAASKNVVWDEMELRAPKASPTLASPTLNDGVTFEQTTLAAHSSVTNFVADPTVSQYQTINADALTSFTSMRFLHATNIAAGRQTVITVFAGTNPAVAVNLVSPLFLCATNQVNLTAGQAVPISFTGYGSNNTNVIAAVGAILRR